MWDAVAMLVVVVAATAAAAILARRSFYYAVSKRGTVPYTYFGEAKKDRCLTQKGNKRKDRRRYQPPRCRSQYFSRQQWQHR
jgi:hypothetical protein